MDEKAKLYAGYLEQTNTLAKVEKATEITKLKRSAIAKEIHDKFGKGPHDLGDGKGPQHIVAKGGTYFFTPGRGASKKTEEATPS